MSRYFHICHTHLYGKWFTNKKSVVYCIITWVIGIMIDIPNLTGWGGHYYDLKTLSCVWDRLASLSYSIFFPMSSIVMPCVLIMICYLRIFLFAYRSNSKVEAVNKKDHKNNTKDLHKSLRIAKGLFASFLLFTVCW